MPYLLLALLVGAGLAFLSSQKENELKQQLRERDEALEQAKKGATNKATLARLVRERNAIATKLAALEAGLTAREKQREEEEEEEEAPAPEPKLEEEPEHVT